MLENLFKKIFRKNKKELFLSSGFGSRKKCITAGETLLIENDANQKKEQIENELTNIFEKYLNEPNGLFKYIEEKNTPIYRFSANFLFKHFIGFGFIHPKTGIKGLIINLLTSGKFSFSQPPVFILATGEISIITFYYEFYKWYNYISGNNFIDIEQDKLTSQKIASLSYDETIKLKYSVKEDITAINFVLNFVKNHQSTKDALEKMKNDGSISL